jgi:uncharacterized alpha-E superfamily protein
MLSRVADNLYWLARYLERAENLARLVDVNANLMLDLPAGLAPGWQPLVTITGSDELFTQRARDGSERSVIRFIVADDGNPGSMVSSLARAREIARTIRDILPREVWEHVNDLHHFVADNAVGAAGRRTRHAFLQRVILGAQTFTGMLEGIVNDDAAPAFMSLGRNLERADMTSRIVDVRAAGMLADIGDALRPFSGIQWMSVLRSLSGDHMYRLRMRDRVHPRGVVRFLLADECFPRACGTCLLRMEQVLARLPDSSALIRRVERVRRAVGGTLSHDLTTEELHAFIDRLQVAFARINDEITQAYFGRQAGPVRAPSTQSQTAVPAG